MKIAKYGLDNWVDLREYTPMEAVRQQLKLCSRQYNLYMKTIVALQNNLISLTDKTFPGVNELFSSPERADGHQKWVDFVMPFWHCECVCQVSEKAFTERYRKWCKRKGYNFNETKALDLYPNRMLTVCVGLVVCGRCPPVSGPVSRFPSSSPPFAGACSCHGLASFCLFAFNDYSIILPFLFVNSICIFYATYFHID